MQPTAPASPSPSTRSTGLVTALWRGATICAVGLLAAATADQGWRVWRALRPAPAGTRPSRPYQYRAARARRRVLIVGDSTGVGIGATCPTHTIAGQLAAEYRGAEFVNLSVSGACVDEVEAQLQALPADLPRFDLVLLHVGGNDIMRRPNLAPLEQTSRALLAKLLAVGERLLWIGPGDVGLAPLFRAPFSWWMSRRTQAACNLFHRLASEHGVEYIGFHTEEHRELLRRDGARYFSDDGIHPNSDGYRYCYGVLKGSRTMSLAMAELTPEESTPTRIETSIVAPPAHAEPAGTAGSETSCRPWEGACASASKSLA